MRRYQKKRLLGLMGTLDEAHGAITAYIEQKDVGAARALLIECQQCAATIGGVIECEQGEGAASVSLLEDYCETLYQASLKLDDAAGVRKVIRQLYQQAGRIESSIMSDIKPDKLQIVFMPYKASMWDCMQSVWRAAQDDPECEARVAPIPYFDMLPGLQRGRMHDESGSFPPEVPVERFGEFELGNPDAIVIHNPYDDTNLVTQVHPDFFCDKLKEHTDMLVYIPYFVSLEDVQPHLCVNPGVVHADRVFVESGRVRETYRRELKALEDKRQASFGADGKFVALGSPKLDRVIRTKAEDCAVPDEWRALIERPDGSRKKVVLYNSSMANLIDESREALDKLKNVLAFFKDRPDAVLLWRPHPLNMTAYAAMRAPLLEEYRGIVDAYRREPWGIYDDTADLSRAIALSDAYYGDASSLVALYLGTGKPVLVQSLNIDPNAPDAFPLLCEAALPDGEAVWFTAFTFNALLRMDRQTRAVSYMGSFPGEKRDGHRLYASITAVGRRLYFAPLDAKAIAEYDRQNGVFKRIPLPDPEAAARTAFKFFTAVAYRHWVFFVPGGYPAVLRYDTQSGRLDAFSDWVKPLQRRATARDAVYFRGAYAEGSRIVAPAACANAVVVFDMDTCESRVHEVGGAHCRYGGVCFDGRRYWLSPRGGGPVVRWDRTTGEYTEYGDYPKGCEPGDFGFPGVCFSGGFVWLFPRSTSAVLKIDVSDPKLEPAGEFVRERDAAGPTRPGFTLARADGDKLFVYESRSRLFIEHDTRTGERREWRAVLTKGDRSRTAPHRAAFCNREPSACKQPADCCFLESESAALDDFLDYIREGGEPEAAKAFAARQCELMGQAFKNADGTAGQAIYAHIRRLAESREGETNG